MTRSPLRILIPVSAAALAGTVLPVSASAPAAADPGFGGYSSLAVAAPVKIEFYEPTIPIPANPQAELEMAYTKVEADSGSSAGRASWLWPGDPVGEGAKTFGEQLGLPPQLFENGYPVQVNSKQPSGEESQSDEPFPGAVMRTRASDTKTIAQAGWSPDGQVQDGTDGKDGGKDQGGGGGAPGLPDLPGIPGIPPLPGLGGAGGSGSSGSSGSSDASGLLQQFGQAITGGDGSAAAASQPRSAAGGSDPGGDPSGGGAPGLPPQVAALVDLEGYTSSSQNVFAHGLVTTTARAALGDVSLLGGMITLDGIVSTSTSSSDGTTNTAGGRAVLGGMTVNGQEFSFGPSGAEGAGQHQDVPELPDPAKQALAELGVTITLPKPELAKKGEQASSEVSAIQIQIDTGKLRHRLDVLPIDDLINQLPDNPKEIKSNLQAIAGLSPRVVITLGTTSTEVQTVQGISIPTTVPDNDPGTASTAGGSGPASGPSAGGGSAPAATAPGPAAGGDAPSADGDLPPSQLTGSGLPPLYSIPGAILAGGIALAAVGGSWLRRIGVLATGGAGSCSHGLDSGLPDLRKA